MRFFILFNLLPNPNRADRATNQIHFTMWFGMHEFIKLMRRNQFNAFCAFANIFFAEIGKYCGNAWYHLLPVFDLHRWSSWFDGLAIWLLRNGKNICHNSWPNAIDKCSVMLAIITTAEFSAIYRDDMWNFGDEKKKTHEKNALLFSFLFQIKGLDSGVMMDIERWTQKKNTTFRHFFWSNNTCRNIIFLLRQHNIELITKRFRSNFSFILPQSYRTILKFISHLPTFLRRFIKK